MPEDKLSLTMSIVGAVLFVSLSVYLLTQDAGLVGPL